MNRAIYRGIGACLIAFLVISGGDSGRAQEPPNVVLVLVDDADEALVEEMPKISALIGDQGMTFDRFYATESLCCPSRATLLTGEYVHNHGVLRNHGPNGGVRKFRSEGHERRSVAAELRQRGYLTGHFGKYLNKYGPESNTQRHVPPFWNRWFGLHGPEKYDYTATVNGGRVVRFGDERSDYVTTVIARRSEAWISGVAGTSPFFASVSMIAPHDPYVSPPNHRREFKGERPPVKPSFNEKDRSDKPRYVQRRPLLTAEEKQTIYKRYRERKRMLLAVDDYVGRLVDTLAERGVLNDTYIFVSSDNGWLQGEHVLTKKKLAPYEEKVRLPLLVRGPGIAAGSHTSELVTMADLFATFTAIAGGNDPRDGRSVLPLLGGSSGAWRDRLLIEHLGGGQVPNYFGIVTDQYKYVRYHHGEEELYDLVADPFELESRHDSVAHSTLKLALGAQLDALRVCSGASCRAADGGPQD